MNFKKIPSIYLESYQPLIIMTMGMHSEGKVGRAVFQIQSDTGIGAIDGRSTHTMLLSRIVCCTIVL